ncbi:YgjV family protein [Flagellimonas amoyensis]|uniref:YgjV family protein n=1 Tax=Flagellimonas amoyensis TaxID=2169401 RepID=UPI000D375457|nr:YgjV family protein [Allomuricauda amoyensis]
MKIAVEIIGYLAITAGFFAATKKEIARFRVWHLISSAIYVIYGFFLESGPLIISSVAFCIIHVYHLRKMRKGGNNRPHMV